MSTAPSRTNGWATGSNEDIISLCRKLLSSFGAKTDTDALDYCNSKMTEYRQEPTSGVELAVERELAVYDRRRKRFAYRYQKTGMRNVVKKC